MGAVTKDGVEVGQKWLKRTANFQSCAGPSNDISPDISRRLLESLQRLFWSFYRCPDLDYFQCLCECDSGETFLFISLALYKPWNKTSFFQHSQFFKAATRAPMAFVRFPGTTDPILQTYRLPHIQHSHYKITQSYLTRHSPSYMYTHFMPHGRLGQVSVPRSGNCGEHQASCPRE